MSHILTILSLSLFLSFNTFALTHPEPSIIPRPLEVKMHNGDYSITSSTKIFVQREFYPEAKFLARAIQKSSNKKVTIVKGKKGRGIIFIKKPEGTYQKEAYKLKVSKKGIIIEASHRTGAFYAVQNTITVTA